jgi:hypothetical protein
MEQSHIPQQAWHEVLLKSSLIVEQVIHFAPPSLIMFSKPIPHAKCPNENQPLKPRP